MHNKNRQNRQESIIEFFIITILTKYFHIKSERYVKMIEKRDSYNEEPYNAIE